MWKKAHLEQKAPPRASAEGKTASDLGPGDYIRNANPSVGPFRNWGNTCSCYSVGSGRNVGEGLWRSRKNDQNWILVHLYKMAWRQEHCHWDKPGRSHIKRQGGRHYLRPFHIVWSQAPALLESVSEIQTLRPHLNSWIKPHFIKIPTWLECTSNLRKQRIKVLIAGKESSQGI